MINKFNLKLGNLY